MFRAVVLLLLLTFADARAETQWGVAVGAGPTVHLMKFVLTSDGMSLDSSATLGATARLDAGYRVADSVAVGVHLGIGYVHGVKYETYRAGLETHVPFEAGVGAQFVIADRVRIAPWVGFFDTAETRVRAGGAELGFDILVRGRDRISAVATLMRAGRFYYGATTDYSIGAGVAYRYW